ncbi:hypothetical protein [Paraburkholderia xenovorans]|uniref:hypothetical protein n=1 Tax=Paraburkholderia xenovorans TaxID=36873 RepID=UPI0038B9677C
MMALSRRRFAVCAEFLLVTGTASAEPEPTEQHAGLPYDDAAEQIPDGCIRRPAALRLEPIAPDHESKTLTCGRESRTG